MRGLANHGMLTHTSCSLSLSLSFRQISQMGGRVQPIGHEIKQGMQFKNRETFKEMGRQTTRREADFQTQLYEIQKVLLESQEAYNAWQESIRQQSRELKQRYERVQRKYRKDTMSWDELLKTQQDQRRAELNSIGRAISKFQESQTFNNNNNNSKMMQNSRYETQPITSSRATTTQSPQYQQDLASTRSALYNTRDRYDASAKQVYTLDNKVRRFQKQRNSLTFLSFQSVRVAFRRVLFFLGLTDY